MLSDTTVKVSYSTDGDQTTFPITFEFSDDSHIEVYLRDDSTGDEEQLTVDTDYTVSGLNVETVQTYDEGYTLVIVRAHPSTQTLDLEDGGAMPADDLEDRLDRITQIVQQHDEKLSRALLLPVTSEYENLTFPEPEDGYFLEWDGTILVNKTHYAGADGIATAFAITLLDDVSASEVLTTLGISAFVKTILDDANAAAVLTTLGVSAFAQTFLDDTDASGVRTTLAAAPATKGVTNGDSHDHVGGDGAAIAEGALSLSDVTTLDVSTTKHGFAPKAPDDTTKFLRGDASWVAPLGNFTLITDPGTDWIASKTSGWTADNFSSGNLEVDFSAEVPAGAKAVLVSLRTTGTAGALYVRAKNDSNISNTPHAGLEYAVGISYPAGAFQQAVIPIDGDGIAQFTVENVNVDVWISHVRGYFT